MLGAKADYRLPTDCARRIVAEVQGALDSCAERQRQLERSLRVSRRLLQVWEPARALAPEPETKEEAPTPACTPSAQDLRELELLTQALEKAVRVRKGPSKAGQRDRTPSLTSASNAAASGATAPTHSQPSSQAGSRASGARSTKGAQRATIPAKDYPKGRPLSRGDRTHMRTGSQAAGSGPGLGDQQMAPSADPRATKPFTLKDKGTLLQLPPAFRKAASQNSRLWAQLSAVQASDSTDATRAAKTQFLQKLQLASGCSSLGRPGAAEVEAHAQSLRKACTLLRLHMQKALSAAPTDWTQEYRCLLVLEGLQAIVGQCLHRIQVLQTAVTGGLSGPRLVEKPTQASPLCGGKMDSFWSPELLLYSSTKELQTLATLKLRMAMLDQQIHLEKVLMAELLPLINTQEPGGSPWLALCRAAYSLLCGGGEHFLTVLRDDPAD